MQNLIGEYLNKSVKKNIISNFRGFLNKNDFIFLNYFYWLYKNSYKYSSEGYCVKIFYGKNFMYSFLLYNNIKNIKVNQLFFFNDPYIFFLKKRLHQNKNKKRIFIF